tara:strand:- start:1922 stop:2371 length:450 start_codon:yes stop_codon:yes gene_type:complete
MIDKTELENATLTATVADDFTSTWTVTDSASKKWECELLNYNPETRIEFTSKEDVETTMTELLKKNPNYWSPFLTADEKKAELTPFESAEVRGKRDALLSKYEWTVNSSDLDDAKKAEWKTYRQALRDLPTQSGFPWEADGMTWPVKPL